MVYRDTTVWYDSKYGKATNNGNMCVFRAPPHECGLDPIINSNTQGGISVLNPTRHLRY